MIPSRRKFLFFGTPILLILLLVAWSRTRAGIPVEVIPVRRGPVASTITSTTSGSVEPRIRATVNAELSARVTRKEVEEGARVAQGRVVISLDPEAPREELAAAEAGREAARARLAQARAKLLDADREIKRSHALYDQKVVSRKVLEGAALARDVARRAVEEAEASLTQLERNTTLSRIRLGKADVRAPFAGIVIRIHVDEGDSVAAGTPLFEIADDGRLHVEAPIDEIDAAKVRLGQRVRLVPDAYPDRTFLGQVTEVAPVVSTGAETNRTVRVKVALDDSAGARSAEGFKIGMSVDVEVVLDEVKDALYIPTFTLIERAGRRFVLVADGGRSRERTVRTGLANWETTQVLSGLSEGDRVITTLDDKRLREGERIRIEQTGAAGRARERR